MLLQALKSEIGKLDFGHIMFKKNCAAWSDFSSGIKARTAFNYRHTNYVQISTYASAFKSAESENNLAAEKTAPKMPYLSFSQRC